MGIYWRGWGLGDFWKMIPLNFENNQEGRRMILNRKKREINVGFFVHFTYQHGVSSFSFLMIPMKWKRGLLKSDGSIFTPFFFYVSINNFNSSSLIWKIFLRQMTFLFLISHNDGYDIELNNMSVTKKDLIDKTKEKNCFCVWKKNPLNTYMKK